MTKLEGGGMVLKISDFGLSKFMTDDRSMTSRVGTPKFLAPEVEEGSKDYDLSADIWSAGIIAYLLGVGEYPPEEGTFCSMRKSHLLPTLHVLMLLSYFLDP